MADAQRGLLARRSKKAGSWMLVAAKCQNGVCFLFLAVLACKL